jgi:hypothetical protein
MQVESGRIPRVFDAVLPASDRMCGSSVFRSLQPPMLGAANDVQ